MATKFLMDRKLRGQLVKKINKMIDLPFLNEQMEAQIIKIAVDKCLDALMVSSSNKKGGTRALEDEMDEAIGDEEKVTDVKKDLVDRINANIDIPGMNEEQEADLIGKFVDVLMKVRDEETHGS